MRTNRWAEWLVALLLLLGTAPCWATEYTVTAGINGAGQPALTFSPSTLTINAGDTVKFVNGGGFHNVIADDNSFSSGAPSATAWSVTVPFNTAGTFGYYCGVHGTPGTGMFGSITVQGAAPPPAVNIGPGFTGAWYDPNQSGHGLFLEVLQNNALLAWWFTFSPAGDQSWFGGVGNISGSTATISVLQTTGGKWIPNFDPSKVTNIAWGTLTFTFTDCNHGRVDFNSNVPAYGVGSMNLTRLTLPSGLTCP
jgi:plastocyanin